MSNARAGGADSEQQWPSRKLPIELVYQIIALIDYDRKSETSWTLAACSLVCQAWTNICRKRIFQSIIISARRNVTSRLSFLYFTAPHLNEYINEVMIDLTSSKDGGFPPFPDWTPECFGRLKNLRTLALENGIDRLEWSRLPGLLMLGIKTLLGAPHLRKLHIRGWTFGNDAQALPRMLSLCATSLQDLTFGDVGWKRSYAEVHELPVVNLVALSALTLGNVDPLRLRESLIKFPNLKTMAITIGGTESSLLWVPPGVQDLFLFVTLWSGIPKFEKDTIRLSMLHVDMLIEGSFSHLHGWLEGCINNLPFPDLLERLEITLEHHPEEFTKLTEYETLSRYLAGLCNRGALKRGISITINMPTPGEGDEVDIHEERETQKLREGFGSILGSGVDIRLFVERWTYEGYQNGLCQVQEIVLD